MFTWSKLLDSHHSIWFKVKTVFIYITPNQNSHFKTSTFTQSMCMTQDMSCEQSSNDERQSQIIYLKINVNVILNVFLFVLQRENKFCAMN